MVDVIKANGARIPAIGLGTWTLEGDACASLVAEAIARGYRHIDTAVGYSNESEVGAGIRKSGIPRHEVFVTTKLMIYQLAPDEVEENIEASLARLGLDYVDLLLIHWPNRNIPLEGTLRGMNAARSRGQVKHIGVSNFTTRLLRQAIELSESPIVANQVEYHPYLDQTKVSQLCREMGVALVAYSPLHQGGKLLSEPQIVNAANRHNRAPAQIVLRWLVQQPGVAAVPRTTRASRLVENLSVFDFSLTDDEMQAISALRVRNDRLCNFDYAPDWDPAGV